MERIRTGALKPGDMIETELELEEKFHASRPTVRQALNKLTTMGYLVRIKGKGSFVTRPKLLHRSSSVIESYRSEVGDRRLLTQVDRLQVIRAEDGVAHALGIQRHAPVVELARTRRIENEKAVVNTIVYVPRSRFPGMEKLDFENASFYDALDDRELRVTHAVRTIEIVLPSAEVAEKLEISPFEPVFYVESTGYMANDLPIEYSKSYYPGSNSKFMVDIHR